MNVNPAVPAALSALIQRLLEKDQGERPHSAHEVAEALAAIGKGRSHRLLALARRKRWLAVACILLALSLIGVAGRSILNGNWSQSNVTAGDQTQETALSTAPSSSDSGPDIAQPSRMEPLRVKSLDLIHYVRTADAKIDIPQGNLGDTSFSAFLGDRVHLAAKLSRPAYAYIIAFRPDGVMELCFPNSENTEPPLTDTPRYPAPGVFNKAYSLLEGTGLWVFAVVASESPLPAYKKWLESRKIDWHREEASTGCIWRYDGSVLEINTPRGIVRGKDDDLIGPASRITSLGKSLGQNSDTAIYVAGFGVGVRN
jgi:hypothetical protein